MTAHVRPLLALALATSVVAAAALTSPSAAVAAPGAPSCSSLDDPMYQRVNTGNAASLVTPWAGEAAGAARYGFNQDDGVVFRASRTAAEGLVPVHRLYKPGSGNFLASANPGEWTSAVARHAYEDQGLSFYVSPVAADCLVPVNRYVKRDKHRLAASGATGSALAAAGWRLEGVAFYAAPASTAPDEPAPTPAPAPVPAPAPAPAPDPTSPSGDTKFSFAVYPDTQQEVGRDSRFVNRANWLVENKSELDLRFVTHVGDVVNWDTPDHDQYEVASKAMVPLERAKIPYSLAIGNHDTQATGPGGSARDPRNTRALQRDTTTFNQYFNADRYGAVSGAFEKGKVDNVYSLYEAGDAKWMVLVLELWPRQSAVDWAKAQVAAHPDHNVVVVTHSYLNGGGGIAQGAEYGDTSPQELYDQLISRYANIRLVFSGHVGQAQDRVDTGVHGNKIYSFLTSFHSNTTNPTRLVEVDTEADSLRTWIYAPWTDVTSNQYSRSVEDVDWVR